MIKKYQAVSLLWFLAGLCVYLLVWYDIQEIIYVDTVGISNSWSFPLPEHLLAIHLIVIALFWGYALWFILKKQVSYSSLLLMLIVTAFTSTPSHYLANRFFAFDEICTVYCLPFVIVLMIWLFRVQRYLVFFALGLILISNIYTVYHWKDIFFIPTLSHYWNTIHIVHFRVFNAFHVFYLFAIGASFYVLYGTIPVDRTPSFNTWQNTILVLVSTFYIIHHCFLLPIRWLFIT